MAGHTIRITITDDDKERVILTGTSYKYWWEQAVEYIYRNYGSPDRGWCYQDIAHLQFDVDKSHSRWIGWGGLKWCSPDLMQDNLNREGVQRDEPDNPKPRRFDTFKFNSYYAGYEKLMKELRKY